MKKLTIDNSGNPFRLYENAILISSDNTDAGEQDFVLIGDPERLSDHIAILMHRHPVFYEIILNSTIIYDVAKKALDNLKKEGNDQG